MAKPTPGPWKAETYGSKTTLEIKSLAVEAPAIVNWPGFDDVHRKWNEHLANAKLMAAAPQMYEALQDMVAFAKQANWQDATTGRQILLKNAQSALDAALED